MEWTWILPHIPHWSGSSCALEWPGWNVSSVNCQEDDKNVPTANVLPKWQVTSFSGLLFFWLQKTPRWTALGLCKMWLPRKVNSLQKLQVDNGSDLQEKICYKTYLTVYLERSCSVCMYVCVCVHVASTSCLKWASICNLQLRWTSHLKYVSNFFPEERFSLPHRHSVSKPIYFLLATSEYIELKNKVRETYKFILYNTELGTCSLLKKNIHTHTHSHTEKKQLI